MDKPYDRSSKFLIEHHGGSILRLAGITSIRSCRAVQPELVQPSQIPDGLLEVFLEGRDEPAYPLIEIATYPERRNEEQMLRGALLVLLDRGRVPELLTLVLRPRGNYRVPDRQTWRSPLGLAEINLTWRVVELWTVPAEQLFAADDAGLIPWVPLTQFDDPPEAILQQCRERIDRQAPAREHENLLAVTQVMAWLRYNDPQLLAIIGGRKTMIESPLIQELIAEKGHRDILRVLATRFGAVPLEIQTAVQTIQEEARLDPLLEWAVACPDLDAFRARFSA